MDEFPDNVEIDEDAFAVLEKLKHGDPATFAAVVAACSIIATWATNQELHPFIKRYELLCNSGFKVWRYKHKKTLGDWRIFFFALDKADPPTVLVAAVIKYESQDETYDDPRKPHVRRIRTTYLRYQAEGLIRR